MSSESQDPNGPESEPEPEPEAVTEAAPPAMPGDEAPPAPPEPTPAEAPADDRLAEEMPAEEPPAAAVSDPEPVGEQPAYEPPAIESYPPPPAAGTSAGAGFDFAAVPRSVWISFGGAVLLLLSVFFDWYTASVGPFSVSGSGWDTTDVAKLVFLLALVAVAAWAVELFAPTVDLPWPAAIIAGAAGAAAAVLVLYRIIAKPHAGELNSAAAKAAGISYGTAWGIWVALLAAIAVAVGAYLRMNERA